MNGEYSAYAAGFITTFLISLILAIYAFKRRSIKLHTFFILVMFSICIWSLGSLMELLSPAISQKIFWAKISYIGITTVAPFLFLFVLSYGKYEKYLKNFNILLLMIIPVIITILAFTNEFHKLIWTNIIPVSTNIGTVLVYEHGLAVWLNLIYSYPLLLMGMFLMAYIFFNSTKIYKLQTAVALIGIAFPLVINIIYLTGNLPALIDLTPIAFCLTSLLAALAVFKFQLLNILPLAHKNLFNNMTNGFMVFDAEDILVEINRTAEEMFQITSNDIGKKFDDIFEKEDQIKSLYLNSNIESHEILLKNHLWVEVSITPLYENLGVPFGKLIIITNIDKRKSYETALKEKQRTLETLISNLPGVAYKCRNDPHWTMKFVSVSEGCLELTGYPVEDLLMNKKISFNDIIHPDDREYVWDEIQKSLKDNKAFKLIYRIKTADSKEKYVWEQGRFVYSNEEELPILEGFITDITDSIKAKEMLKKSLKEKNILLQEIHHRVKNNLMVIQSLLNLQSRYIKDTDARDIFKDSQNRAKSMAMIHESLYKSSDLKRIEFSEYINTLANNLFYSYAADPKQLKMDINVEEIMLDINTAIPLGLILTELLSNCLKYAFPDDKSGEIKVDFYSYTENGENKLKLTVSDNGVGLPEGFDPKKSDSLGLMLIYSLSEQISATVKLDTTLGTKFEITFKEKLEYEKD